MALEIAKNGGLARPKILERILRFRRVSLILAYILAYFVAQFLLDPANMEVTRMSEHSLMPGLVTPKFDKSGVALQLYRRLSDLPRSKPQQKLILDIFKEFGLECFTQKWRSTIAGDPTSGENVYGFIRGHRNDGAEAQLIVVQLGRSDSARRMISRILAFIDYAKEQVYWARDFVIVFVDGGDKEESTEQAALALDAFLFKYQKIESLNAKTPYKRKTMIADDIKAQTGALIAGVVYDLSGKSIKGQHIVNLQTNGLNGQQVNLDVFNGIVKIADSKHLSKVAIFGTLHGHSNPYMEFSPFAVPAKALYTQAFISIEGIHSVMGKYGVQGLTVGLSYDYTERQAGQFIEEVSRMLNNVLERLHQSYFMYILADDMHFLSVAFYSIPLSILVSPLLICAYFEWTKLREFLFPLVYVGTHLVGFLYYYTSTYIYETIGMTYVMQWKKFPFVGKVDCDGQFGPILSLVNSFLIFYLVPLGASVFHQEPVRCVPSVRILILLETSIVIYCTSLINFGLAFFCSAIAVPIVFLMTFESTQRARCWFRTFALMLLNPMTIIALGAKNASDLFGISVPAKAQESVIYTAQYLVEVMIKQHVTFGAHHFFLLCCCAYPIWTMLFSCAMRYGREPRGSYGIFESMVSEEQRNAEIAEDQGPFAELESL